MQEVTAYMCDHCGKVVKHKSSARRHERECKHSLEVRACTTCRHHSIEVHDHYASYNEPEWTETVPCCNSADVANDEEFYFDSSGNPFYIVKHCQYHQPKEAE